MIRFAFATGLLAASFAAHAQGAPAPVSAAKKELVSKVLQLQQPQIEGFARNVVQQNTVQVLQAARMGVQQRVAADRRDAVWRDIEADARKFFEEAFPLVRDKAVKIAPAAFTPVLEERFSEDELKQLVALLESPVGKKFAQINNETMRTVAEKLMAEVRPAVDPKMQAFQQQVGKRLQPAASVPAAGK